MSFRLLPKSHADAVTLTVTSTATNYDVANLQIAQPSIKWRSEDTADQAIYGDLGALKPCSGFSLSSHNLSIEGTIDLTLYEHKAALTIASIVVNSEFIEVYFSQPHNLDPADTNALEIGGLIPGDPVNNKIFPVTAVGTNSVRVSTTLGSFYLGGGTANALKVVYNETKSAFLPTYGWGESPWGIDGWGGFPADGDYPDYTAFWFDGVTADWFQVVISDSANADGYVEAGRIKLASQWAPAVNFDWGAKIGRESRSRVARTRGGSLRAEVRPSYRTLEVGFSWLTKAEAIELLAIIQDIGKYDDVLVAAYPEDESAIEAETTMLARLIDHSDISIEKHGSAADLYFEEEI